MLKAAFTIAAWYEVSAECLTPVRTGGTDNDPETLLMTKRLAPVRSGDAEAAFMNAQPVLLLQGSSLAGALRGWLEENDGNAKNADALFGSSAAEGKICPGRLRVSDGVFQPETETALRPRLKLNPKTRAAENDKKFDMAHIQTGARFDFRLIWLGAEAQTNELETVERMLSALHNGEIRLGAQKTNGFGRVSLRYRKRVYTLSKEKDRRDWLNKTPPSGDFITPKALKGRRRVEFVLRFRADSLLVKAGAEGFAEDGEDGKTSMVTIPMTEAGYAVIPGSSVKGAVRARAEQIAALKGLPVAETESVFGRGARGDNDNGRSGVARFEDIRLPNEKRVRVKRIRINRFTGGVVTSGLFTEEPVSTTVPAELRVSLPADRERACALLLYALRDLAWNLYGLGSGRSIGRGNLDVSELEIRLPGGGTALFRFRDGFRCEASGEVETVQGWLAGLEAKPE